MLNTARALRGMVTAPHRLASEAGIRVLRDGGNAIEAAIAMAATLAVVYPHMNGLGGDGFWLIAAPNLAPLGIDAAGTSGRLVQPSLYEGLTAVPWRGPLAANTVAGTVAGWRRAMAISDGWGGRLPLHRLFEEAIHYADAGFPVSASQSRLTAAKLAELQPVRGFAEHFLKGGHPPAEGDLLRQPALAATLRALASRGLDDFYQGETARSVASDLAKAKAPVGLEDLASYRALAREPLSVDLGDVRVFNMPPPTQGLASLLILALFDRLEVREAEGFAHLHGVVEATKQAFLVRDALITDPAFATGSAADYLSASVIDRLCAGIDRDRALPWPSRPPGDGDTVWFGVVDGEGRAVSMIQSLYFEFGSGLVLPETGIVWQNRGCSFSLDKAALNPLGPGRRPFHTLNPAFARFTDGRSMVYGSMGGEGQPQTQASIFTRYARFGQTPQAAITAPRWLLGRTWGENSVTLKLERSIGQDVAESLARAGHQVEIVADFNDMMGHAGMIVRRADGIFEGAADPRSDGAVGLF